MTRIYIYQCENAARTSRDHISQLTQRGIYSREELADFIDAIRAELHTLDLVLDTWEIADKQMDEERERRAKETEQAAKAEAQEQQEQAQPTEQKQPEYWMPLKSCENCKRAKRCNDYDFDDPVTGACERFEAITQKGDQA